MKNIILGILSVFFLSACQQNNNQAGVEELTVNENVVADAETKLALDGMVCSMGCVSAIQNELRATPGVAFAAVNYEERFATIKFDSKLVNEDALIAAIENIGDHSYSAKKFSDGEGAMDEREVEETVELMEAVGTVVGH